MNRRRFLQTATLAAVATTLRLPHAQAAARRGEFTALRRGVGYYTDRGGTIGWLVSDDAMVVVDSQYPETATACWDGLHARSGRALDLLINTHHHGDHTAGNTALAHAKQILAHENAQRLQRANAEARGTTAEQTFPNRTFTDELRLPMGDESITLRHFGNGHTGGDAIIHFENADIVHMGDLVFNRMPVFMDPNGECHVGHWIEVLERTHDTFTDDTLFIFGHGNANYGVTGSRADVLVCRDYLSGVIDYVQAGLQAGTPVDDLAAIDRLPLFPEHYRESWAGAVPSNIRFVHAELTSD